MIQKKKKTDDILILDDNSIVLQRKFKILEGYSVISGYLRNDVRQRWCHQRYKIEMVKRHKYQEVTITPCLDFLPLLWNILR